MEVDLEVERIVLLTLGSLEDSYAPWAAEMSVWGVKLMTETEDLLGEQKEKILELKVDFEFAFSLEVGLEIHLIDPAN